ncbi:MAG: hypothetical protein M3500_04755 [Actinomycetota bacterium]|nr:hypothetical protein [Actinomycetota bacterium]
MASEPAGGSPPAAPTAPSPAISAGIPDRPSAVELDDLHVAFGGNVVLDGVSLSVGQASRA